MSHTLRGAISAWLALIALQTLVSNTKQASGAIATINTLIQRALSPDVPLIPDRRTGAAAAGSGGYFNMTPAQVAAATQAAKTGQSVQAAGPDALWNKLAAVPSNAYSNLGAVDWSALANNPALHN